MRTPLALLVALGVCLAAATAAFGAADPLRPQQWGLDTIQADAAHSTSTGSGAVVAVLDTGVLESHEDLAGRLVPGHDFVQDDDTPQDENGHGTHVTGIIAADAGNGKGIEGVAPGASVMPVRVLDANGEGTGKGAAKGIDYAVAHGADVINMSFGTDAIGSLVGDDADFDAAVQRALDKGVIVVAAAGNDTLPFCEQPILSGPLLCVGSVDRRGMRSAFSSSGDLMAPGGSALGGSDEDILSTYNDGKYEAIAGTSQATPHVAGVAALLVALGVRGKAATDRILATASDAGASGPDDVYGAGILNAKAAVAGLKPPGGGGGSGGGGSGGGGGGSGGGAVAAISYVHTQKIATVRRHGVKVRCRPTAAGRCRVSVTAHGKTIASGSRKVRAGKRATVTAKLTKAGRKLVRKRAKLKARVSASVPGAPKLVTGKLTLKR
jgi:subtilisin family serine protease